MRVGDIEDEKMRMVEEIGIGIPVTTLSARMKGKSAELQNGKGIVDMMVSKVGTETEMMMVI
jgi:hypothetical protein